MAAARPDPTLARDQLAALQHVLKVYGTEFFLANFFWLLTKEEAVFPSGRTGLLVPFRLNREQRVLLRRMGQHNLLLKARQIGGTTFWLLVRLLLTAITQPGTGSLLISQNNEYAEKHFGIARRAWRLFGVVDPQDDEANTLSLSYHQNLLHTEYSSRRELVFDMLDSRVMIASAEVEESGQGVTLHHIVASEYSRWPHDPAETLSNVRGALVKSGTVDKECTANGAAGPFYEDCLRAMNNPDNSDAVLHFFSWWVHEEYTLELPQQQQLELEADLQADELRLIAQMHRELSDVAYL